MPVFWQTNPLFRCGESLVESAGSTGTGRWVYYLPSNHAVIARLAGVCSGGAAADVVMGAWAGVGADPAAGLRGSSGWVGCWCIRGAALKHAVRYAVFGVRERLGRRHPLQNVEALGVLDRPIHEAIRRHADKDIVRALTGQARALEQAIKRTFAGSELGLDCVLDRLDRAHTRQRDELEAKLASLDAAVRSSPSSRARKAKDHPEPRTAARIAELRALRQKLHGDRAQLGEQQRVERDETIRAATASGRVRTTREFLIHWTDLP